MRHAAFLVLLFAGTKALAASDASCGTATQKLLGGGPDFSACFAPQDSKTSDEIPQCKELVSWCNQQSDGLTCVFGATTSKAVDPRPFCLAKSACATEGTIQDTLEELLDNENFGAWCTGGDCSIEFQCGNLKGVADHPDNGLSAGSQFAIVIAGVAAIAFGLYCVSHAQQISRENREADADADVVAGGGGGGGGGDTPSKHMYHARKHRKPKYGHSPHYGKHKRKEEADDRAAPQPKALADARFLGAEAARPDIFSPAPGDRVQVWWPKKGQHFAGTVTATPTKGSVDVLYDDGTDEAGVPIGEVSREGEIGEISPGKKKSFAPADNFFSPGDRVDVVWAKKGRTFAATVTGTPTAASVDVHYDDGTDEAGVSLDAVTPAKPETFGKGDRVGVWWPKVSQYFFGEVTASPGAKPNSVGVKYDDGTSEAAVPVSSCHTEKTEVTP